MKRRRKATWAGRETGRLEAEGKGATDEAASDTSRSEAVGVGNSEASPKTLAEIFYPLLGSLQRHVYLHLCDSQCGGYSGTPYSRKQYLFRQP
jgi:hypothetical protein